MFRFKLAFSHSHGDRAVSRLRQNTTSLALTVLALFAAATAHAQASLPISMVPDTTMILGPFDLMIEDHEVFTVGLDGLAVEEPLGVIPADAEIQGFASTTGPNRYLTFDTTVDLSSVADRMLERVFLASVAKALAAMHSFFVKGGPPYPHKTASACCCALPSM